MVSAAPRAVDEGVRHVDDRVEEHEQEAVDEHDDPHHEVVVAVRGLDEIAPMPMLKIFSTTREPTRRPGRGRGSSRPGVASAPGACFRTTLRSESPLARAVRMKSRADHPSTAARQPRIGRRVWCGGEPGADDRQHHVPPRSQRATGSVELEREDEHEQRGQYVPRHAGADHGDPHRPCPSRCPAADRADDAERDAHREAKRRSEAELHRHGQAEGMIPLTVRFALIVTRSPW